MAEQSLLQITEKIFKHQGGWIRIKGELSVYYWSRVAGPDMASKMEAIRFRDGCLFLQTDNPALAHQISLLNYEIIQRYQKILGRGVVKSIKIKIGPVNIPSQLHQETSQVELAEDERVWITNCCQAIPDSGLAESFQNMMNRAIFRHKKILAEHGSRCQSCNTVIASNDSYCPCCERLINQEISDYQQYIQKTKHEPLPENHFKSQLSELHENLISQILKQG